MTSPLEIAKTLIQTHMYREAKQTLENDFAPSGESLYMRSLLHRYFDEYEQEKNDIDAAMAMGSNSEYIQQRLSWHQRSLFDRLTPRKSIEKGIYEHIAPVQEILDNMCFVAGADSKYFTLLVECLESIRNTRLYKDVPICVLDCGLTDDQKHYLVTHLKVAHIKDPGWDVVIPAHFAQPTHSGQKDIMARCHLSKHFPQYKYIFHIDADIWVQDETGINLFLQFCAQYKVGIIKNSGVDIVMNAPDPILSYLQSVPNYEALQFIPWVAGPLTLIETGSSFDQNWIKNHTFCLQQQGHLLFSDEVSLIMTMAEENLHTTEQLVPAEIHISSSAVYRNNEGHLFSTQFNSMPSFIHHDIKKHDYFKNVLHKEANTYQRTSVRYRTWPWQDKPQIQALLESV